MSLDTGATPATPDTARAWVERIQQLAVPNKIRIMNVCGGHERTISMAGLRQLLPAQIELIAGPGCPVCVCPEEDLYLAIQLSLKPDITLVTFGDMLRVPVNGPKTAPRSLLQAKAAGADIRPVASPLDVIKIARNLPQRTIVFFAAGFETTMAPVAAMVAEGVPDNLVLLLAGRLTWPAVAMLLREERPGFQALIAPGHVATVMGAEEWRFVAAQHQLPTAIAGFTAESLLAAIYSVVRQVLAGQAFLDNCYSEVVQPHGNVLAQHYLHTVLEVVDAPWRGIGILPRSGLALTPRYYALDARRRYAELSNTCRPRAGDMPAGCACAQVVLGKIYPDECRIYGKACTPQQPVGPCMVSEEGACRIWWASGVRQARAARVLDHA